MAELYYDTGRIQEAKAKGGEAIAQFSSIHQSEPENSLVTFGLATRSIVDRLLAASHSDWHCDLRRSA